MVKAISPSLLLLLVFFLRKKPPLYIATPTRAARRTDPTITTTTIMSVVLSVEEDVWGDDWYGVGVGCIDGSALIAAVRNLSKLMEPSLRK